MGMTTLILLGACAIGAFAYLQPPLKEHGLSEVLLREVVEKMGRDLDSYLDDVNDGSLMYPQLMSRSYKDSDYQDSPSVRDQEYLRHSTLWVNPFSQEAGDDSEPSKTDEASDGNKQDNLPAYCNPPNPCPVGYTGEEGCLEDFENTAAFSRDYQRQQDCMCDSEHMFDCSVGHIPNDISQSELNRLVQQFHVEDEHKSLVAKKFHVKKSSNPYLEGEKLPVAAKKGINIGY